MKLSIITINYNNRDGLTRTIDSVVRQTSKEFEWIVIDGLSTDGSIDLIQQNKQCISYWVSEKDGGIYNAMNKGLQRAHGEYCLFLNSGDWLAYNDTIENILPLLSGDIFVARSLYYNGQTIKGKSRYLSSEIFSASTLARESFPHQSTFIKTSLLRNYDGYDETFRLLADWAFFMQMALNGTTDFVFTDICTAVYDTRGLSAKQDALFTEEKKRILAYIPDIYRKDIPLALSLQDVQTTSFGRVCYKILYRLTSLFKRSR